MENTTAKDVINKIKQKKNNCDHFLHDDVILIIKENQIIHEVFLCILRFFYISTLLGSLRWN